MMCQPNHRLLSYRIHHFWAHRKDPERNKTGTWARQSKVIGQKETQKKFPCKIYWSKDMTFTWACHVEIYDHVLFFLLINNFGTFLTTFPYLLVEITLVSWQARPYHWPLSPVIQWLHWHPYWCSLTLIAGLKPNPGATTGMRPPDISSQDQQAPDSGSSTICYNYIRNRYNFQSTSTQLLYQGLAKYLGELLHFFD